MKRTAFFVRPDTTLAVMQRPEATLDYGLDYSDLVSDGDTIVSSVWTSLGGVVLSGESQSGAIVSVRVAGTSGTVTNTVSTAHGRTDAVSFCVLPPAVVNCG